MLHQYNFHRENISSTESWDSRARNMESQSHLLTHAELKRRGITRYDAEIIIANGLPLPDPIMPTLCSNHLQNKAAYDDMSENKCLRSTSLSTGSTRSLKSLSTPSPNILSGVSSKDPSPDENIGVKSVRSVACSRNSPCAKSNRCPIKRRSPRKRFCNTPESQEFVKPEKAEIKEERSSPGEGEVLHKLGLDSILPREASPQHAASVVQNIKMEPEDDPDNGYEYTDAELRSHNLCDFLDRSPRLKRHKGRKRGKRVHSVSSKTGNELSNDADSLPPLINPGESCPLDTKAKKPFFSPLRQHHSKCNLTEIPVRQSPRLHGGIQRPMYSDCHKELLSGRQRSKAAHLAQELNCLVAKASTFAQRLTNLMLESSVDAKGSSSSISSVCGDNASSRGSTDSSSHSYQDPPVLEPEPPIISPAGSRRSSLDSPDVFSGILPPPAKLTSLSSGLSSPVAAAVPPRRSRSVEEEHLSSHGRRRAGMRQLFPSLSSSGAVNNLLSPSSVIGRSRHDKTSEEDMLSKSDGYRYRRKRGCSPDIYDKPPLLKRDHIDTKNSDDSSFVSKKQQHTNCDKPSSINHQQSNCAYQKVNLIPCPQLEITARDDLHRQQTMNNELREGSPNHYHVGEDIYLKQTAAVPTERDCSYVSINNETKMNTCRRGKGPRGSKRRQPRLIFRMKKDPELKKLLKAESAHSPNLQFKWDDDSDCDIGSSSQSHSFGSTVQNHRADQSSLNRDQIAGPDTSYSDEISSQKQAVILQSQGSSKDLGPECEGVNLSSSQGLAAAPTSPSSSVNSSLSGHKISTRKRVRKVRLKMIDTSLNFDLVSPPLSPHK